MEDITFFRGAYSFLSNFYDAPVLYDDIQYLNSEAAYQAQKCEDWNDRLKFATLQPNEAKAKGRRITLRPDWEEVKDDEMYKIVLAKFTQNPSIANYY